MKTQQDNSIVYTQQKLVATLRALGFKVLNYNLWRNTSRHVWEFSAAVDTEKYGQRWSTAFGKTQQDALLLLVAEVCRDEAYCRRPRV